MTNYRHEIWQEQPLANVFQNSCFLKFVIFTGNHLCWSLFLINLQVWMPDLTLNHQVIVINIQSSANSQRLINLKWLNVQSSLTNKY